MEADAELGMVVLVHGLLGGMEHAGRVAVSCCCFVLARTSASWDSMRARRDLRDSFSVVSLMVLVGGLVEVDESRLGRGGETGCVPSHKEVW